MGVFPDPIGYIGIEERFVILIPTAVGRNILLVS